MRLRIFLLHLAIAGSLFGHCPFAPSLPECPTAPPAPTTTPTTPIGPAPPDVPLTTLFVPATDLLIEAVAGAASAPPIKIPIIFLGDGLAWFASTTTNAGGNWLSATPARGYDDVELAIAANASALRPGTYTGVVTFVAPLALNSIVKINVTLRVRDPLPATIQATSSKLDFTAQEAAQDPSPQKFNIRINGETNPDWSLSVISLNGGPWLSATPISGLGNSEATVTVKLGDLSAGVYVGRITVSAPKAANKTIEIPVSFTVTKPKSSIATGGIVNAASLEGGAIAPGGLISIAGQRLGPATGLAGQYDVATQRFPTTLGGTRVFFDNVAAPILYVSANQINAQVPMEVAGKSTTKVRIESTNFDPDEQTVAVTTVKPGLFSLDGRRAAVLNQDFTLNEITNPADRGSVLQLFVTGQGLTTPRIPTGAPGPSAPPFASPDQTVEVLVDNRPAEVLFAGLAPGAVGLLQVNVRVPAQTVANSNCPLTVRIGGVAIPRQLVVSVR